MSDLLDRTRTEINDRLDELRPTLAEYERLRAAVVALDGTAGSTSADGAAGPAARDAAAPRLRPGPRGSRTTVVRASSQRPARPASSGSARKGGRPKGSGRRAIQALAAVRNQPGMTVAQLATRIGADRNYLYKLLPDLAAQGKLVKRGRGWHPASEQPSSAGA